MRIEMEDLLRVAPPPEETISEVKDNTFICEMPNFIDHQLCDDVIELFHKDIDSHFEGQFHTFDGVPISNTNIKNATDLAISSSKKPEWQAIDTRLYNYVKDAALLYRTKFPTLIRMKLEDCGYQIHYYKPNEGQYKWHSDGNDLLTIRRQFAFILYLNDVEVGGETEFAFQNIKVKPEKGKVAIFPAAWTHIHRGCVPISGPKYVITSFFNQVFQDKNIK